MNGIVAENGKVVTDEMIADWESALERDEWPSGWVNVGEIVEGKLPKAAPETVTLSLKVPAAMKRALEKEAKAERQVDGRVCPRNPRRWSHGHSVKRKRKPSCLWLRAFSRRFNQSFLQGEL